MAVFLTRVIFVLFDFSFSLGKFMAKCGQTFISSELSRNIKFAMYITQTVFSTFRREVFQKGTTSEQELHTAA